ncbi:hypothetical protein U0070_008415 [Myodes glareolus]|uniref:Uncharacterized protein n=1 Tax=Myodes glareolus TaxID=447135 RepID=A0AAW0H8S7_MYOGA
MSLPRMSRRMAALMSSPLSLSPRSFTSVA